MTVFIPLGTDASVVPPTVCDPGSELCTVGKIIGPLEAPLLVFLGADDRLVRHPPTTPCTDGVLTCTLGARVGDDDSVVGTCPGDGVFFFPTTQF